MSAVKRVSGPIARVRIELTRDRLPLSLPALSWIDGEESEVITNGIRQGASSKRKGGEALGPKARYILE